MEQEGPIETERRLRSLRETNPAEPSYAFLHARVLFQLGRDLPALAAAEQCVELQASEEYLKMLLEIQKRLYRFEDAMATSERALSANPDSYAWRLALALACTSLGRFEEAEQLWNAAVESSPRPEQTLVQKARALLEWGLIEDAERECRRSIELNPAQGRAYNALFSARRVEEADRDLVVAAQSALGSIRHLDALERQHLHFALGKAFDNLGNYGRANTHFEEGNGSIRQTRFKIAPFDPDAFRWPFLLNKRLFSKPFVDSQRSQGNDSQLPIFVLGMMRSGTTLLEQILSAHPQIGGCGELAFWGKQAGSFIDFDESALDWPELSRSAKEFEDLLRFHCPGKKRMVDKNPANLICAGLLHAAFPKAKILYIRRANIDVALSIWTTWTNSDAPFAGNRSAIVTAIQESERMFEHWRLVIPPDSFMEVRYEDLVTDLAGTVPKLIDFCGLEWHDACLSPEKNRRLVKTPSLSQVRQKVNTQSIGRFKNYGPWLDEFAQLLP